MKLLLIFAALPAFGALTTIQDTLRTANGGTCQGQLLITNPTFMSTSGQLIMGGTFSAPVVSGVLNVAVEPGSYTVVYNLNSIGCSKPREYWIVPTSGSAVNLAQVRSLAQPIPPTLIPLQFLAQSGAAIGQAIIWNGSRWIPGAGGGGGGGGDVFGPGASANGELTVFNGTTGKAIKPSGLTAGLLKVNALAIPSNAIAGTDYAPPTSGSAPLKGNGTGGFTSSLAADIVALFSGCSGTQSLGADGTCHTAGSGDVVGPSLSTNGELTVFSGATGKIVKVSGLGAGIVKLNASAVPSIAASGTDYAPPPSGASPLKGNGAGGFASSVAADIIGLFSGCSGTLSLGADGFCHAAGTGDVSGPGVSANGELTVFNGTTGKSVKVSGLSAGIVKVNSSAVPSIAGSGTDYAPPSSGSAPLKGNGAGGFASSVAADIVNLFSGCSGTLFMGADGICHAGTGGSVFTGSTATSPSFSPTPTFSLADISVKSPKCFEPGAMNANVTSVTFTNKTAGAEFCIAWLQNGTGGFTVAYGGSASNTCTISAAANITTTQHFRVKADGTTVLGTYCSDDSTGTISSGPEGTAITTTLGGAYQLNADSASHTATYYANNSGNRHAIPRVSSGDQLAVSDLFDGANVVKNNQANTWSTGAQDFGSASSLKLPVLTFASLGTPANGMIVYCSDCTAANPAAGGGSGAVARRENGAWNSGGGSGGGGAIAPYSTTVSAQTSVSITAATHGQGTLAVPFCFDGSTPRVSVACGYTRNTSGDLVFSFSPAFTGQIEIGSGGGTNIFSPYTTSPSAQTSVSISAATHGKGTTPRADCFDNSSPAVAIACGYTRNGSGDLVFTFSPAFTGTIEVRP